MAVIVGLWNPESHYHGTRHNVGAEVIDILARRWDIPLKKGPLRVRCMVGRGNVNGTSVVLGLPRVNMNISGPPVRSLLSYFKETSDDLLVIHDDIDLPFARLRIHVDRGAGGHNGVRSITQALGTRDFARLKVGVGRPPGRMDPAAYVLKPFAKTERAEVDLLTEDAADVVERWLTDRDGAVELAASRKPE